MKVKKEGSKSEALPREMEMKMKDDKEKGREDEPLSLVGRSLLDLIWMMRRGPRPRAGTLLCESQPLSLFRFVSAALLSGRQATLTAGRAKK